MIVFASLIFLISCAALFVVVAGATDTSYLHALWIHFSCNHTHWALLLCYLDGLRNWARVCRETTMYNKVRAGPTF